MGCFKWPVRVYHEDTDGHGIVYYANYLKFFERARTEMLRSKGFEQDNLKKRLGVLFVVKSMQVDFIRPARFNEELLVCAEIHSAKRVSLVFDQKILNSSNNRQVFCRASVQIACLDAESFRPKALPSDFLTSMTYAS